MQQEEQNKAHRSEVNLKNREYQTGKGAQSCKTLFLQVSNCCTKDTVARGKQEFPPVDGSTILYNLQGEGHHDNGNFEGNLNNKPYNFIIRRFYFQSTASLLITI